MLKSDREKRVGDGRQGVGGGRAAAVHSDKKKRWADLEWLLEREPLPPVGIIASLLP